MTALSLVFSAKAEALVDVSRARSRSKEEFLLTFSPLPLPFRLLLISCSTAPTMACFFISSSALVIHPSRCRSVNFVTTGASRAWDGPKPFPSRCFDARHYYASSSEHHQRKERARTLCLPAPPPPFFLLSPLRSPQTQTPTGSRGRPIFPGPDTRPPDRAPRGRFEIMATHRRPSKSARRDRPIRSCCCCLLLPLMMGAYGLPASRLGAGGSPRTRSTPVLIDHNPTGHLTIRMHTTHTHRALAPLVAAPRRAKCQAANSPQEGEAASSSSSSRRQANSTAPSDQSTRPTTMATTTSTTRRHRRHPVKPRATGRRMPFFLLVLLVLACALCLLPTPVRAEDAAAAPAAVAAPADAAAAPALSEEDKKKAEEVRGVGGSCLDCGLGGVFGVRWMMMTHDTVVGHHLRFDVGCMCVSHHHHPIDHIHMHMNPSLHHPGGRRGQKGGGRGRQEEGRGAHYRLKGIGARFVWFSLEGGGRTAVVVRMHVMFCRVEWGGPIDRALDRGQVVDRRID